MDSDDDDDNMDVNPAPSESNPLLYALNTIIPLDETLAEVDRLEKEAEDSKKYAATCCSKSC